MRRSEFIQEFVAKAPWRPMGDFGSCPRDTSDLIKSANRKADDLEAAGIPFDPEETK